MSGAAPPFFLLFPQAQFLWQSPVWIAVPARLCPLPRVMSLPPSAPSGCASAGFVARASITQFGLSRDEFENHATWAAGEPAYLKYWITAPADQLACAALAQEEGGANLGFVGATVAAYLARCGVRATDAQTLPSAVDPGQQSEQWTLRRVKPLGARLWGDKGGYEAWRPDLCPGAADSC